jgi:hypothetical protein
MRLRKDVLLKSLESKLKLSEEEVARLQKENEHLNLLLQLFQTSNPPASLHGSQQFQQHRRLVQR